MGAIPALDGLRGIAVLWVIAFHYATLRGRDDAWVGALDAVPLVDAFVRNGYLGVDLFFLLSGFLLALPWLTRAERGAPPPSARDFYARRIRRIVPAYYVQLALLFLVFLPLLRGWDYWKRDLYVILWNGLSHAAFIHNTSPLTSGSLAVNGALWTLAVEAQFYVLLPLVARTLCRAPWGATLAAFAAAAGWQWAARHDLQALVDLQLRWGRHWGWPEDIVRHLLLTQLPSYLAHFALGALLARLWLRRGAPPRAALALAGIAAFALLARSLASGEAPWREHTWILTTVALGTLLFAAACARGAALGLLGAGPLAAAGRVSYSAYLYHLPLLLLWNRYLPDLRGPESAPLYLAAVFALATLSWRFIELRFASSIRRGTRPGWPGSAAAPRPTAPGGSAPRP